MAPPPGPASRFLAASARGEPVAAGLLEDAIVVGCEDFEVFERDCGSGRVRRPAVILEKLPPRARGCAGGGGARPEPPARIEWFCFPEGEVVARWRRRRPPDATHSFALHADRRAPLRGVVLVRWRACERYADRARAPGGPDDKRLWVPGALCLLTRLGVIPALSDFLAQTAAWLDRRDAEAGDGAPRRRRSGAPAPPTLCARLCQLADEAPRPRRGALSLDVAGPLNQLVEVREFIGAGSARVAERPRASRREGALPRQCGGGGDVRLAALTLGTEGLAAALACVLAERPVVLHSDSIALLGPVAEALLALIAPLELAGVYVSVLPRPLLELLDAPQAFLLGVESSWIGRGFRSPAARRERREHRRRADAAVGAPEGTAADDGDDDGGDDGRAPTIAPGAVLFDLDEGTWGTAAPDCPPPPQLPAGMRADVVAATRALRDVAVDVADSPSGDGRRRSGDARLAAAEARLQLCVARHVVDLLDPSRRAGASATPRRDLRDARARGVVAVARSSPDARAFATTLVETQHFQQLFESHADRLEAVRAKLDVFDAADVALAPSDVASRVHGPPDDAFRYRLPPPLDPDDGGGAAVGDREGTLRRDPPALGPAPAHAYRPPRLLGRDAAADAPSPTRVYRYGTLADLLGAGVDDLRSCLAPPDGGRDTSPPPPPPAANGGGLRRAFNGGNTSPRSFAKAIDEDDASGSSASSSGS